MADRPTSRDGPAGGMTAECNELVADDANSRGGKASCIDDE